MDENDVGGNLGKVILRPKRPGESIKVAETVLKRRDRNLKAAANRVEQIAKVKKLKKDYKKGKLNLISAESLVKTAIIRKRDTNRRKTIEKKQKKISLTKGSVVVIGRNGRTGATKEVSQILKGLGFARRHTLVFHLNTEETTKKLRVVEPFVFWGVPTFKAIFNIIHKKALFRDPDAKDGVTVLSDNILIEKHLGDLGVLCTEDLAHVIHTGGKAFHEVTKRLCPVPLGNAQQANGMVYDNKFTSGDLAQNIDSQLQKLMGD
jgi:large subunit ribosomal protein L7e